MTQATNYLNYIFVLYFKLLCCVLGQDIKWLSLPNKLIILILICFTISNTNLFKFNWLTSHCLCVVPWLFVRSFDSFLCKSINSDKFLLSFKTIVSFCSNGNCTPTGVTVLLIMWFLLLESSVDWSENPCNERQSIRANFLFI